MTQVLPQSLRKASEIIEGLIKAVSNETLQGLLEKVVREAGFLSAIMHDPEKSWLMQLLNGFYEHVKDETRRKPHLSLHEFIEQDLD